MRAILGVALLLAWAGAPALAQERGEAGGQAAPEQAAPERPAAEPEQAQPERPQPGRGEAQDKPERAATPPGRGHPANRDAVVGDMKNAEVRHRERLAMIGRLRSLAEAKGQTQRLAALDELEAKENAKYERRLEKHRAQLGDENFRKAKEHLSKGRGKEKVRDGDAKKPERPAGEAGRGENGKPKESKPEKEKERAKPEKEKAKPEERAKPKEPAAPREEKPKAEQPKERQQPRQAPKAERGGSGQSGGGDAGRGQAGRGGKPKRGVRT